MNDEPYGESDPPEDASDPQSADEPSDSDPAQQSDAEPEKQSAAESAQHSTAEPAHSTEDTRPSGSDAGEYTTDARTLDSRVRTLWIGRALLTGLLVGGVATAITFATVPDWWWIGPAVFVFVTGLGVGHAILLYRSWRYEVREDSLLLDRGVVTRVRTVVPYVRVQHIDTSRGPIERAAGLSSLVVYTAGSRGADVTIPGLRPWESNDLQKRLKALAIESEGEDAV